MFILWTVTKAYPFQQYECSVERKAFTFSEATWLRLGGLNANWISYICFWLYINCLNCFYNILFKCVSNRKSLSYYNREVTQRVRKAKRVLLINLITQFSLFIEWTKKYCSYQFAWMKKNKLKLHKSNVI